MACWYFSLSNSHCGRPKSKTDVSRSFGGTMTKQSDTEHNNTQPAARQLWSSCDVWSSVALSKPVATVCPAQRRLYACVGYTVVHKLSPPILLRCCTPFRFWWQRGSFFFSLSLSFPSTTRYTRKGGQERERDTHTHKVCRRRGEEGEREGERLPPTTIPRCVYAEVTWSTPGALYSLLRLTSTAHHLVERRRRGSSMEPNKTSWPAWVAYARLLALTAPLPIIPRVCECVQKRERGGFRPNSWKAHYTLLLRMPTRGSMMICHDPDSTATRIPSICIYSSLLRTCTIRLMEWGREKGWSVVRKRALVKRGNE